MKKMIAAMLAIILALSLVGCAADNGGDNGGNTANVAVEPLELMNTVWSGLGEDERFDVFGGDYNEENMREGEAGNVLLDDADSVEYLLTFPASMVEKVESAASIIHMMNVNTFTAGAFKLKDAADAEAVCSAIRDALNSKQWMCGFPDKMLIVNVNGTIVSVFGSEGNVDNFRNSLTAAYENAEIVYDEPVAV